MQPYRPDSPPSHWDFRPDDGEGSIQFPVLLFDLQLDPDEAIVLLALGAARREHPEENLGVAACTLEQLSRFCFGLPVPAIGRILDRLVARGFIAHRVQCRTEVAFIPSFSPGGEKAPANDLFWPRVQDDCPEPCDIQDRYSERMRGLRRRDELATMPYPEYLQTPEWKGRRAAEIDRAGGRCELCNAAGPFHVHHRTYDRRGHESPGDLLVLCPPCHTTFHEHRALA